MRRIQSRSVVLVVLRLVITLLFVAAIVPKLTNPGMWAHLFAMWGYPSWGLPLINAVEIIGVVALWIPAVTKWAAAPLLLTTAGATGTWLVYGPTIAATFPGVVFVLLGVLTWLQHRRERRDLLARYPERL